MKNILNFEKLLVISCALFVATVFLLVAQITSL